MPDERALLTDGQRSLSHHYSNRPSKDFTAISYSCRARCRGEEGQLTITDAADVSLEIKEGATDRCCGLPGRQDGALRVRGEDVVGATLHSPGSFSIWWCKSKPSSRQPKRQLRRSHKILTTEKDAEHIIHLLQKQGSWQGHALPRKVTALINPVSGRGRSKVVYNKQVLPILHAAGLQVTTIFTERPGHAADIVREADLEAVDMFVVCGGDGTIHELLQGYLSRSDWKQAVQIPFAQIPSGSGNALAANCGLWSPVTAAHAICKGRQSPVDIASIAQPGRARTYSFLSVTFGMISNLDVGTDHLRWMGALRFHYGGLLEIAKGNAFLCKLALLPADAAEAQLTGSNASSPSGGPATPHLDSLGNLGHIDLADASALPKGWKTYGSQEVGLFAISNLAYLDFTSVIAPHQRLSCGELHMVWANKASRATSLEFLFKVDEKGSHIEMKEVHQDRLCAFALQPECTGTMIVVDGERMPYERIFGEIHRGLCQVIVAPDFWEC